MKRGLAGSDVLDEDVIDEDALYSFYSLLFALLPYLPSASPSLMENARPLPGHSSQG
jgi:hypothetical protein